MPELSPSIQLTKTARELGFRMPAEFEPVEAVWLTQAHKKSTWPGCDDRAVEQHHQLCAAIEPFARVELIGRDHHWKTNDSWIRDYGPIFVTRQGGTGTELAGHDFVFNGWGGKYDQPKYWDDYVPAIDDVIPVEIAAHLNMPLWRHDVVLEGGSIDVNGRGTVMTTEQCLLNPNRNPSMSREAIEQTLHDALGTRHVIWLPGGIVGDDTDGHIDDVARFIDERTVVIVQPEESHEDFETMKRNREVLDIARDQDGDGLDILELPAPKVIKYDDPVNRQTYPLPASHANFLIVNDGVIVPTFGQASDDVAMRVLDDAMPGRTIVGVRCEWLVVGLGAAHCLTMQQPAVG